MKTFDRQGVDLEVDKTPDKRNLTPQKGDCQLHIGGKVEEQIKKPQGTFLDVMDSIACGVEAWFEENIGYSRRVTETTVDIARKLGIPDGETERWAARRLIRCTEKGRVIKSLIERL